MARCGYGNGRNYDAPKTIDGRRMPFVSQATYLDGDEIDIVTEVTVYHKGHFEFKICPLGYPDEIASQACFDRHPLTFVEDLLYGAGRDSIYPYRAYLAGDYERFVHRMKLPDGVTGNHVLLHCFYPGYVQYYGNNPTLEENASLIRLDMCPQLSPDGRGVPEQFWNCAEITIVPKTSNNELSDHEVSIDDKKEKKDKDHKGKIDSMLPQEIIHHESSHVQNEQDEKTKEKKDNNKGDKKTDEIPTETVIHHETTHKSESQIFADHRHEKKAAITYVSVKATHDATVSRKNGNKNISPRQLIQISGVPRVLSFVRFDLPEEIEKNSSLKSATLRMYTFSKLTNSTRVIVQPVMGSFNASNVTWKTSPMDPGPRITDSKAINANSKTWINIDVTDAFKWSLAKMGYSAFTLRLSTKNSRTLSFASRNYSEGLYSPQVVLEIRES
eukprot:CCRYP_013648-RA/>CCRYP_013648-RA protein AED:0.13 eAED:0.13 QI:145/0.66/0.5/1/0.33/0.5/4/552/442